MGFNGFQLELGGLSESYGEYGAGNEESAGNHLGRNDGNRSGSEKARGGLRRVSHNLSGYIHSASQNLWRRRRRLRRRKDFDDYPLASSMNSFLTRKKNRPRQSSGSAASELGASKPYEDLAPSPRTPTQVGTTSQGLRNPFPSVISAPITNPTLTTDGTELNLYTMHRSRQEREQLYNTHPATRPISPTSSPSMADSSTVHSESDKTHSHHRSTTSVSETSVSSGRMSPSVSDFGGYHSQRRGTSQQTTRPTSRATTRSDRMSTNARSVISDTPSQHNHATHIGNALHAVRHGIHAEEFYFPRPDSDEEIEVLFQEIKRSLDLGDNLPNMTIDQKWAMVYNAEQLRWSEERKQTKKQAETGFPAPFVEGSPEWYIQRFMDRTITMKQASSLEVSLRSNQLRSTLL
jgi:cytokinesis protein